ncbi:MAG: winged helix-turn-helix transcriptional regulator [Phycisphaerae bacterium]|nr:winged helix-turn-helix transcriptional regulator [Phycisphaerae bacterium]
MPRRSARPTVRSTRRHASIFAALGDETRLALLLTLCASMPLSITQLSEGSSITRQAITKHLRVLEDAGLVASERTGRQMLFRLKPQPLSDAVRLLDGISRQWDQALARLKTFVER